MKQSSASSRKSRRLNLPLSRGRKVIWASTPFRGRLGAYLGVALDAHQLSVAVQTPAGTLWVLAHKALSAAEAESWAASGFNHP